MAPGGHYDSLEIYQFVLLYISLTLQPIRQFAYTSAHASYSNLGSFYNNFIYTQSPLFFRGL